MRKRKKWILVAILTAILLVIIGSVISRKSTEGITTGTIKITCENKPIGNEEVNIQETEKNTSCEIWKEKNLYSFKLETPEKTLYNLRITLEGELLKQMKIGKKKLIHDFQIFPVNDKIDINAELSINYMRKNGEWIVVIKTKSIDSLGKQYYHNEEEFPIGEKNNTLMGIE